MSVDLDKKFILFLSLSSAVGSLGIFHKETFVFLENHIQKKHSDFIFEATLELLKQLKLSIKNIDKIILDYGPGSFTGVRSAVCFAKSISYVYQISIIPMSSFRFVYFDLSQSSDLVAINAYKDSIYFQQGGEEPKLILRSEFLNQLKNQSSSVTIWGDAVRFYQLEEQVNLLGHQYYDQMPHVKIVYEGLKKGSKTFLIPNDLLMYQQNWDQINPFYMRSNF